MQCRLLLVGPYSSKPKAGCPRSWRHSTCRRCFGSEHARFRRSAKGPANAEVLTRRQRPFCNYYGINFVLYELSTPFLNFHWFMDKLGMTGSTAQLLNGVTLIASFGGSRLIWGTYQNVKMYSDIWEAYHTAGGLPVPTWLAGVYMLASATLTGLNVVWFGKMIKALRSRFDDSSTDTKKKE